jgi:hypothetical protein
MIIDFHLKLILLNFQVYQMLVLDSNHLIDKMKYLVFLILEILPDNNKKKRSEKEKKKETKC